MVNKKNKNKKIKKKWENYSLAPQITTRFALSPTNCQHSDFGLPNYQNL
jgi:hypothetical protein